jgi:hypothetical protein
VPGIRSETEGAGNRVGVIFNSLPQLAAEAKGCCGSQYGEGAGDGERAGAGAGEDGLSKGVSEVVAYIRVIVGIRIISDVTVMAALPTCGKVSVLIWRGHFAILAWLISPAKVRAIRWPSGYISRKMSGTG